MTLSKIQSGKAGEDIAANFLQREGYRILERNFRNKLGEIDIVAKENGVICFVEVKARATETAGTPFEAVSRFKQRKLSQLALSYLKTKKLMDEKARFDVVSVFQNKSGESDIQLLKNAFDLVSPYAY